MKTYDRFMPIALGQLTKITLMAVVLLTIPACTGKLAQTGAEQSQTKAQGQSADESQSGKVFLWSIESPQNTLYLLGSVHLLQEKDYPLPAVLETAYQDAERLVFEVDLNEAQSPEVQQLMLKKATLSNGETLQTVLSSKTYQLAEQKAEEVGLPIQAMAQFEPWFFSLSLLATKLNQLGFQAQYGVDRHYYDRAVKDGKEISALETIAEQINVFDALNPSNQDDYVQQTLLELDTLGNSITDIVQAWKVGDLATIENLLFESFEQYPDMRTKLFDDRNQNWLQTLVPLLEKEEDYLVVVGAGHLVGDNNVLQLLEDKGYSADQL